MGGGADEPSPDVYKAELEANDVLLLCTDGLTKHLSDEDLRAHLQKAPDLSEKIAGELVERANAGGSDNVTVVAARFG